MNENYTSSYNYILYGLFYSIKADNILKTEVHSRYNTTNVSLLCISTSPVQMPGHVLTVSEKNVLKKFRSRVFEVTGILKEWDNVWLRNLSSSLNNVTANKSRRNRRLGHVARMTGIKIHKGNKLLVRYVHSWKNNIEINLENKNDNVTWIQLA
jgi:hypothetical protein